jgi:hypothetical protein
MEWMLRPFFKRLINEEFQHAFFQKYSATVHTTRASMDTEGSVVVCDQHTPLASASEAFIYREP